MPPWHGPRPLADVVRTLERRHGIVITYEDPPYLHDSQRADVTDAIRRTKEVTSPRVFVPRGGPFSFEYTLRPEAPRAQMPFVVSTLLEEYRSTHYAGAFRMLRTGDMFHVVPSGRKTKSGTEEPYEALLST